jgi:hypothetical protein
MEPANIVTEPAYEAPAGAQPDPAAPAGQPDPAAAPTNPDLIAANARAEAYREIAMGRQPDPDAPAHVEPQAPLPTNPIDLLDAAGKERLRLMKVTDSDAYESELGRLAVQLSEMRVARAAAPMISAQAQTIVQLFKAKMARQDPQYAADIEPIFDAMIRKLPNLSSLVGMSQDIQDQELSLRWQSARSQVLDKAIKNPPKPAPALTVSGPGSGGSPGGVSNEYEKSDPMIAALHRKYKFTPAQLAEINAGVL